MQGKEVNAGVVQGMCKEQKGYGCKSQEVQAGSFKSSAGSIGEVWGEVEG